MAETALRPRTILEILDAAFSILRRDYLTFVTVMAIASLPNQLFTLLLARGMPGGPFSSAADMADVSGMLGAVAGSVLGFLFWYPVVDAALMVVASRVYLGEKVTVADALRAVFNRFGTLVALVLIKGFMLIVGFALLFLPALYVFLRFFFVPATTMLEDATAEKALSRSGEQTREYKGKIFVTMLLVYIVYNCLGFLVAIPAFLVPSITGVVSVIFSVLVYPIFPITITLLYYDRRIRKEGFDIELMSRELDVSPATPAAT
jgi:hypothetical protein